MELKFDFTPREESEEENYNKTIKHLAELQEQAKNENTEGLAWYNWPQKGGFELLKEIRQKTESLDFFYDLVVVVGIGGSYLGTKAVNDLFGASHGLSHNHSSRKPILFVGNDLSEHELIKKLEIIENHSPVFCVVSKSGSTFEPMAAYCALQEQMNSLLNTEQIAERTFVITDDKENNPLLRQAKEDKCHIIFIPKAMGGRFSILSAASMVPLALAGHKVKQIMQGAASFFNELEDKSPQKNLAVAQYACTRFAAWNKGKRIELLAINEPTLCGLAAWWQQLFC